MVMLFIAMIQRIRTDPQRQYDHEDFERSIMDNINAKQGKTGKKQRQQGTMNGAGQRSPDS